MATTWYTKAQADTNLATKANASSLATVATSGKYTDLTGPPQVIAVTLAATAPSAPAVGDVWADPTAPPGIAITVAATAPTSPNVGDLWADTSGA